MAAPPCSVCSANRRFADAIAVAAAPAASILRLIGSIGVLLANENIAQAVADYFPNRWKRYVSSGPSSPSYASCATANQPRTENANAHGITYIHGQPRTGRPIR